MRFAPRTLIARTTLLTLFTVACTSGTATQDREDSPTPPPPASMGGGSIEDPPSGMEPSTDRDPETPQPPDPPKRCGGGTDPFSRDALFPDLDFLAADARGGRSPGTAGDEATLAFIEERFRCLGLKSAMPDGSYRQKFTTSSKLNTANMVGYLPGSDPVVGDEIIVIGAHHDHLGTVGGAIFNGANDNASGVVSVLAIARSLVESGKKPRRTLVFTTYGYEENDDGPCEGSEHFVAHPPSALPLSNVVYMINMDMVGTYPSERVLYVYGSAANTPGRALLTKHLPDTGLTTELTDSPDNNDSDFQAFCDAGVPYLYFATDDLRCYHKACDDVAGIDFPSMGAIAKAAGNILLDAAESTTNLKALRGTEAALCPK